ncbi:hypothetical protein GCM10027341_08800 [Spirosoma knui]
MKLAAPALAQSAPAPKAYTYLIYHKLSPGLTIQDALPVEKEWRAVNQAAVDEGNMIGWYMLAKQMSSNTNPSEYDYVTVIVTPSMGIKGASPAGMSKIYGDSVKTRMADLQKRDRATAPVVKMEIWETVDAVFSPGFTPAKTPLVAIDFMRLRDPAADWTSLVAPMKRQAGERVQNNTIAGWDLSQLVVPNGSEKGYSLIAAQSMATMEALANRGAAAANPEQTKLRTQQSRTFEVVRQEVFRIMEFTAKPSAAQATK